jgi:DNA-binding CsgD family transcriptional regulator
MEQEIYTEANKIWNRFTKEAKEKDFTFSLAIYKTLLSIFHIGPYYYYVFNVKNSVFDIMSEEITAVLGYDAGEMDVPLFLSKIHPDDQPYFLNFEYKVTEFFSNLEPEQRLHYKVSYDYRIQKKDGTYTRILQQVLTIQLDENKRVLRTLGIHTEIIHLKPSGKPVLSFIGLNGEPSYMDVNVKKVFAPSADVLSTREKEILSLLLQGKNSEQIAKELFISSLTVNTHRKNIREKTGCSNTITMLAKAVEKGWL